MAINTGGGVIIAPTGAGKTTMGIEIAARLGERCLILMKSIDLAKQWSVDKATPSATRLIQSIGRARRPHPGKSTAFVLDIIDSHPFGLSSYKKRSEIYQQQGFLVR